MAADERAAVGVGGAEALTLFRGARAAKQTARQRLNFPPCRSWCGPMNDATATVEQDAPLPRATIHAIMIGIMLAMFLCALEQTIVAPALPTIGRSAADVENLSWVVTAYLLSHHARDRRCSASSPTSTGGGPMMLIAIVIFVLGSVACALAPTLPALVAARALQGLGGGGILPLAQTVVADILSPRERPLVPELLVGHVHERQHPGTGAGRISHRLHPLVDDLLDQPAARRRRLAMTNRALKRLPRHERPHRLDIPGAGLMVRGGGRLAAGAELGRQPLRLGLRCRSWAWSASRRSCGGCSCGAC